MKLRRTGIPSSDIAVRNPCTPSVKDLYPRIPGWHAQRARHFFCSQKTARCLFRFTATSDSRFTSVGMSAIERFLRPVCHQNFPDELLPDAPRQANPLGIWWLNGGASSRA